MTTSPPGWKSGSECSLCKKAHPICTFRAGSLFCVDDPCLNPHHRTLGGT